MIERTTIVIQKLGHGKQLLGISFYIIQRQSKKRLNNKTSNLIVSVFLYSILHENIRTLLWINQSFIFGCSSKLWKNSFLFFFSTLVYNFSAYWNPYELHDDACINIFYLHYFHVIIFCMKKTLNNHLKSSFIEMTRTKVLNLYFY